MQLLRVNTTCARCKNLMSRPKQTFMLVSALVTTVSGSFHVGQSTLTLFRISIKGWLGWIPLKHVLLIKWWELHKRHSVELYQHTFEGWPSGTRSIRVTFYAPVPVYFTGQEGGWEDVGTNLAEYKNWIFSFSEIPKKQNNKHRMETQSSS